MNRYVWMYFCIYGGLIFVSHFVDMILGNESKPFNDIELLRWTVMAIGFCILDAIVKLHKAIAPAQSEKPETQLPELHFASALIGACVIGGLIFWMGVSGYFGHLGK